MITIYEIKCKRNSKIYIGQTSRTVNERWNEHKRDLRRNRHGNKGLQLDYNRLGEGCFKFSVVDTVSEDQTRQAEHRHMLKVPKQKRYNAAQGYPVPNWLKSP